jgi:hypothetical protein
MKIESFKPGVSKNTLLLIAAVVWTLAGTMLFVRGAIYLVKNSDYLVVRFAIALVFGFAFFRVLFLKISQKHIHRIKIMETERPWALSFFNIRSYLIMALMITMGITLRKSSFVNKDILYTFYVGMGMPLLISAGRFYVSWIIGRKEKL